MNEPQTQNNPIPVTEPNKMAPAETDPKQTEAEKEAAEKAKSDANPGLKS